MTPFGRGGVELPGGELTARPAGSRGDFPFRFSRTWAVLGQKVSFSHGGICWAKKIKKGGIKCCVSAEF